MFRLFRRHRRSIEELEEIRVTRAEGINRVFVVSGIIILVLVAFIISMLILTPLLEKSMLIQERERTEELLKHAKQEETEAQNRYRWMSNDPEYFEQQARDRANQAKAGETVIHQLTPEEERAREEKEAALERERAAAEEARKHKESKKSTSRPRHRR